MYPRLFSIGPFTIYSYGLMLGIGFIAANYVLNRELKRKKIDPNIGSTVTLFAILFGIAGSKILYLIENWSSFVAAPVSMAFSPGGLTWYGGFLLATFAIMLYIRKKKIPFLIICDAAAPGIMIAYGIARLGCHLAGDGDYGVPTDLPWACVYSNGTYPPSLAFRDFPEIVEKYGVNGVVPDNIPVHPAPVYEFIYGILLFILLWKVRERFTKEGQLFMLYLMLSGAARFFVEIIRVNPKILFGLTEAQLIAMVLFLAGAVGMKLISGRTTAAVAR